MQSSAPALDKPRKLFEAHGLFRFVTPKGGTLWRLKYRFGSALGDLGLSAKMAASRSRSYSTQEQADACREPA